MSNPQGPGKQGRKDAKAKASQPHQAAAGAPGRSEHQQHGESARPQSEQGHMQRQGSSHPSPSHPSSSHPSQSMRERERMERERMEDE
jgi:hypothetical protein